MAPSLTKLERQAWLAIARGEPALVRFARYLDEVMEAALEQTGQEIPVEHGVVILLRLAATAEPVEAEGLLAA